MSSKTRSGAPSSNNNKKSRKQSSHSEEEQEFEVEKILEMKVNPKTKTKEYLIKWKNFRVEESTWEPQEYLDNVKDIVHQFEKNLQRKETASSLSGTMMNGQSTRLVAVTKDQKKQRVSSSISQTKNNIDQDIQPVKQDTKKLVRMPESHRKRISTSHKKKSISSSSSSSSYSSAAMSQRENMIDEEGDQQQMQLTQQDIHEQTDELVFEEIVSKRIQDNQLEYLIKFQNLADNQWLDVSQLSSIKEEIQLFENQLSAVEAETAKMYEEDEQRNLKNKLNQHNQQLQETSSKRKTAKRSMPFNNDNKNQSEQNAVPSTLSIPQHCSVNEATQKCVQPSESHCKRQIIEMNNIDQGDFKTDNIDRIDLQGDFTDILSLRFEVFWKTRIDGVTPCSGIYSSSYLKRYEPGILIDYLLKIHSQVQSETNPQGISTANIQIV